VVAANFVGRPAVLIATVYVEADAPFAPIRPEVVPENVSAVAVIANVFRVPAVVAENASGVDVDDFAVLVPAVVTVNVSGIDDTPNVCRVPAVLTATVVVEADAAVGTTNLTSLLTGRGE
jgi:hypothetical protein